jgi:SAM-dependent methyltransferase
MAASPHQQEQEYALASMQKYFQTKPEQMKLLEGLVAPYLVEQGRVTVLDVGCGLGDASYFLSQLNPQAEFLGVDRDEFMLSQAREVCAGLPNLSFEEADLHALEERFGPRSFDLAISKQVISWLPGYEEAVRQMMAVARRAVFITSLFYDGRIDFNIRVREHARELGPDGYNAFYNVYSFPIFREFCLAHGAREVTGTDFHIGIDLPRPTSPDRMGTYTVKLESGDRLQISGALLMPWKIVRIEL